MIKEYQQFLSEVEDAVASIGFRQIKNADFEAVFLNGENWSITFEGERYVRPAFDLAIGKDGLKFSIRLLMVVFNVNEKPSLSNQLRFVRDRYDDIFIYPPPYLAGYEMTNAIDI